MLSALSKVWRKFVIFVDYHVFSSVYLSRELGGCYQQPCVWLELSTDFNMCSLFSGIIICEVQLVLKPHTIKQKLSSYVLETHLSKQKILLRNRPMCRSLGDRICLCGRLNRSFTVKFTGDSLSCLTSADKWDVKDNGTLRGATASS